MGVWLEQAASPSCCHPCNVGLEMLGFGLSLDFYTNATRLAHFVIWCTAALVGCSCLPTYCFLLQRKNLTSPRTLSAVSMACTTGRRSKRFSFMYTSSGVVSLFPRLEKASSIGRSGFFRLF